MSVYRYVALVAHQAVARSVAADYTVILPAGRGVARARAGIDDACEQSSQNIKDNLPTHT